MRWPVWMIVSTYIGLIATCAQLGAGSATASDSQSRGARQALPNLVLITLDTTRGDFVGELRDGSPSRTPVLDGLARSGVRYRQALAPAPLTLPSHASLLTGLDPPEHGVRDNSTSALPSDLPTLATELSERGYYTAAFVATRVLDRRFGLARGFAQYDDRMPAERTGEYGFPERDAAAVTTAALTSLAKRKSEDPFFLWIHFYDPHAPYQAPDSAPGRSPTQRYRDEIAFVDREIGRLLTNLPTTSGGRIVAVVGDHGEALGEHGERTHGIFIYGSVLEVPLILDGTGLPKSKVVDQTVATRRLAPSLLRLLFPDQDPALPGTVLPGLGLQHPEPAPIPVFSEARMPELTYGWSPLTALSTSQHRLILAPRPELYDTLADPGETRNLIRHQPAIARRLRDQLTGLEASFETRVAKPITADAKLAGDLRALGYLSGGSGGSGLDPKDGIVLLADLAKANDLLAAGNTADSLKLLEELNAKSPNNVPFLVRFASAQQAAGHLAEAALTFRKAVDLSPESEFLHHHLGNAYLAANQPKKARAAFEDALKADPRFAAAWLSLAELAHKTAGIAAERSSLEQAVEAQVDSVAVLLRLAQITMAAKDPATSTYLAKASELLPELPLPWLMRGQWHLSQGEADRAKEYLTRAIEVAPGSSIAAQATSLLARQP